MKVQELRIGNLLEFDWCIHKVESIHLEGCVGLNDIMYEEVYIDDLKPIQLTEQWLIRFGFKLNPEFIKEIVYELQSEEFQLVNDCGGWFLGNEETDLQITSVHQLQNIYFALTGKEL
jgi:uncharacterized protein YciU (UPF0263 family)